MDDQLHAACLQILGALKLPESPKFWDKYLDSEHTASLAFEALTMRDAANPDQFKRVIHALRDKKFRIRDLLAALIEQYEAEYVAKIVNIPPSSPEERGILGGILTQITKERWDDANKTLGERLRDGALRVLAILNLPESSDS